MSFVESVLLSERPLSEISLYIHICCVSLLCLQAIERDRGGKAKKKKKKAKVHTYSSCTFKHAR